MEDTCGATTIRLFLMISSSSSSSSPSNNWSLEADEPDAFIVDISISPVEADDDESMWAVSLAWSSVSESGVTALAWSSSKSPEEEDVGRDGSTFTQPKRKKIFRIVTLRCERTTPFLSEIRTQIGEKDGYEIDA